VSRAHFIEDLFSSRGRVRVMLVLFRIGEANISRIVRETGMHHSVVAKHLEKLAETGLIEERRYGRIRLFRVNYSNPRAVIIRDLIEVLEE